MKIYKVYVDNKRHDLPVDGRQNEKHSIAGWKGKDYSCVFFVSFVFLQKSTIKDTEQWTCYLLSVE